MYTHYTDHVRAHHFVSQLVAVVLSVMFCATAYAETAGLKLAIATGKAEVELGEPVYLTAMLSNTGRDAVAVFPSLYPEDSALRVNVVTPGGKSVAFVPYSLDLNDSAMQQMAAGESLSAVFPIFYGGRGWTFQETGEYRISAVFSDPSDGKVLVESAAVSLTVTAGDGSGAYLINESKASSEAGKFLLWQQGDHLRAGIVHLQGLVEHYPQSVNADYARLAFAHNLSKPFRDYSIGTLRKADPDAAMKYIEKVDPGRLQPYLKVDKIVTESRSLMLQGNKSKAQSVLKKADPILKQQPALRVLMTE